MNQPEATYIPNQTVQSSAYLIIIKVLSIIAPGDLEITVNDIKSLTCTLSSTLYSAHSTLSIVRNPSSVSILRTSYSTEYGLLHNVGQRQDNNV